MGPLDGKGIALAAVVWLAIVVIYSIGTTCAEFKECGRGDLVLNSFLAVGALMPAWIAGAFVTGDPPDKEG